VIELRSDPLSKDLFNLRNLARFSSPKKTGEMDQSDLGDKRVRARVAKVGELFIRTRKVKTK
jgi:hypothetical protein